MNDQSTITEKDYSELKNSLNSLIHEVFNMKQFVLTNFQRFNYNVNLLQKDMSAFDIRLKLV